MNFLQITGTDDINTAVSYLEMASYDVAVWAWLIVLIDFIILRTFHNTLFTWLISLSSLFDKILLLFRTQSTCISNSKTDHQPLLLRLLLHLSNRKDLILRVSYLFNQTHAQFSNIICAFFAFSQGRINNNLPTR